MPPAWYKNVSTTLFRVRKSKNGDVSTSVSESDPKDPAL